MRTQRGHLFVLVLKGRNQQNDDFRERPQCEATVCEATVAVSQVRRNLYGHSSCTPMLVVQIFVEIAMSSFSCWCSSACSRFSPLMETPMLLIRRIGMRRATLHVRIEWS